MTTTDMAASTPIQVSAAAEHLAGAFSPGLRAGVPHDGTDTSSLLLPGPGAQAFTVDLRPAAAEKGSVPSGRLVIALSAEDASAAASRMTGDDTLFEVLEQAMAGALSALEPIFGPLQAAAPVPGDAAELLAAALSDRPVDHELAVVPLLEGDRHGATVVIAIGSDSLLAAPLPSLASVATSGPPRPLASLNNVEMTVSVELGQTKIAIRHLLELHPGAVVALDHPVTHPVDVFINATLIARGKVVVVDDDFAVQITELVDRP